jgi:hypothetical protein
MSFVDFLRRLFGFGAGRSERASEPRPLPSERIAVLQGLDPSPFGLNSHCGPPEHLRRFSDIGIRWHRIDIDWEHIESAQGNRDWGGLDAVVDTALERNLSLLGVIAYTPGWATANPTEAPQTRRARMPSDPSHYLAFVEAVVGRYGDKLKALSVWNEPNLAQFYRGTREDYLTKLLVPALRLIRQRAPHIVLAGPDLSSSPGAKPSEWLSQVLDAAGDLLDVITHHQYDGGDTPQGRAAALVKLRDLIVQKGFGDRPLWVTETGWMVKRDDEGEFRNQARLLTAMMAEMQQRNEWWHKTFWYDSHGVGWGLLEADGRPRRGEPYPSFGTYASIISAGNAHTS